MKGFAALVLLMIYSVSISAASEADRFGARRWPAQPALTVNRLPDLCNRVLTNARNVFVSSSEEFDVVAVVPRESTPLDFQPIEEAADEGQPSPLNRADVDLDGDGHIEVAILRTNTHSWRGEWYYGYVFPSVATFDAQRSETVRNWTHLPDKQYPTAAQRDLGSQLYYPSALTVTNEEIATGDERAKSLIFEFNKRYFFFDGRTAFVGEQNVPISVFRLRGDGHVELTCRLEQHGASQAYEVFQHLPAVRSFLFAIRAIGAGGVDFGSMQSGAVHDTQATSAEIRAAVRPWATPLVPKGYTGNDLYYQYDERMRAFLEAWSLQELWNRREYQMLVELMAPAEASYGSYLQSAFGLPADTARTTAVNVIQELIGRRLLIPQEFNTDSIQIYFPSTELHQAVMLRDREAFDAALASPQLRAEDPLGKSGSTQQILSEVLPDAVEWPYALDRLLSAGADPNHTNDFGKTPLMVAAHFDRVDSVRKLLEAGAKVNASTQSAASWREGPKRAGRTALMYAAENAGPAVLEALLEAGADPAVHDSEGNDIAYYLRHNPRYADEELSLGVTGLAKQSERYAGPSFRCAAARTASERSICGSEVLRIFDSQIARAFESMRIANRASVLHEQRHWLEARDRSCSGGRDVDCLAEMMRTHLRCLLERAHEVINLPR